MSAPAAPRLRQYTAGEHYSITPTIGTDGALEFVVRDGPRRVMAPLTLGELGELAEAMADLYAAAVAEVLEVRVTDLRRGAR